MTDAPPANYRRGRALRLLLMIGIPVAGLGVGAWVWLSGGGEVGTDNAYVKAPIVAVAPEVSGPVVAVAADENAHVQAGQELLRIDPQPFRIALARAEAAVEAARTNVRELQASYGEKQAELSLARTTLAYAEKERARQEKLAHNQVVSQSGLDDAREAAEEARHKITILEQDLDRIAATLGGEPPVVIDRQPAVRQAQASLDEARLNLARTVVRAPIDGIAAHLPDAGDTVTAGASALSIVGSDDVWVEANFKETDLTWMRPGQPVSVSLDTYPDRTFQGHVASIAQATGAEFSVLPPQNASGNWVKVVQRVPVRIALDPAPDAPPLRAGMSAEVAVSTGHDDGLPEPLKTVAGWFGTQSAQAAPTAPTPAEPR